MVCSTYNTSANTNNWLRSIGVGYFGAGSTNSLLHIDGTNMLLPINGSITTLGEVFRTDAPNISTFWRMYRNGVQKFYISSTTTPSVEMGTISNEPLNFFTSNTICGQWTTTGNLNVFQTTYNNTISHTGFKIGDRYVLWHNGDTTNIMLGLNAGSTSLLGHNNTFLGFNTKLSQATLFNVTLIGANAYATKSNSLILGNKVNVGINTAAPLYTLHVQGSIAAEHIYLLKGNNEVENLTLTIEKLQNQIAQLESRLKSFELEVKK